MANRVKQKGFFSFAQTGNNREGNRDQFPQLQVNILCLNCASHDSPPRNSRTVLLVVVERRLHATKGKTRRRPNSQIGFRRIILLPRNEKDWPTLHVPPITRPSSSSSSFGDRFVTFPTTNFWPAKIQQHPSFLPSFLPSPRSREIFPSKGIIARLGRDFSLFNVPSFEAAAIGRDLWSRKKKETGGIMADPIRKLDP